MIFLEPKVLYRAGREDVPTEHYALPIGRARVREEGSDLTLVTYGGMVPVALQAVSRVEASIEVIDLRTLFPWDRETVLESVAKTGRLLLIQEPQGSAGVAAEVAAVVAEEAMYDLTGPIVRVTGFDAPWPQFAIEGHALIDVDRVVMGIEKALEGWTHSIAVVVFGSSQTVPGSAEWNDAEHVGRRLAESSIAVITGGYGGTMEAVSKGASAARGHVIGITAPSVFPGRQGANPFVGRANRSQQSHRPNRPNAGSSRRSTCPTRLNRDRGRAPHRLESQPYRPTQRGLCRANDGCWGGLGNSGVFARQRNRRHSR